MRQLLPGVGVDPLQNIFIATEAVLQCRENQRVRPGDMLDMVGEVDHLVEIQDQLKVVERQKN